jgi:hypothetical protein
MCVNGYYKYVQISSWYSVYGTQYTFFCAKLTLCRVHSSPEPINQIVWPHFCTHHQKELGIASCRSHISLYCYSLLCTLHWCRIHERTIKLRFLDIILRFFHSNTCLLLQNRYSTFQSRKIVDKNLIDILLKFNLCSYMQSSYAFFIAEQKCINKFSNDSINFNKIYR